MSIVRNMVILFILLFDMIQYKFNYTFAIRGMKRERDRDFDSDEIHGLLEKIKL